MSRKKLTEEQKKKKVGLSIDKKLMEFFDGYLEENKHKRSKYIEKLIREDLKNKGHDPEPNF